MESDMTKKVVAFAIGALAGGVAGYLTACLIIDQIEKAELRRIEEAEEEAHQERRERRKKEKAETDEVISKNGYKPPVTDYTKFTEKKGDLNDLAAKYQDKGENSEPKTVDNKDNPHIITLDEFTNGDINYGKERVTYYEDDSVFTDENEEVFDDCAQRFGANIHLHFGEGSDDPDIVYVRNEKVGVDYEISRNHNSYSVVVLGMPPERKQRKQKGKVRKTNEETPDDDSTN